MSPASANRQAHVIYRAIFNYVSLTSIYNENISNTRAIGRDGVNREHFERKLNDEIGLIIQKVNRRKYSFTRYRAKLISKGAFRNPRLVSIPTFRDRVTLRALNNIIAEVFHESRILRPHIYVKGIRRNLSNMGSEMSFVRVDIEDFFPSIEHPKLLQVIRRRIRKKEILSILETAIRTPTIGREPNERGIPQGLSISNILASAFLSDLDIKYQSLDLDYYRYVDDILIICRTELALGIFKNIEFDLIKKGLNCHPLGAGGKSEIVPISQGIEYLGFKIRKNKISVRDTSYKRMFENLLGVFTQYKHNQHNKDNEERLLWRLNLKITGCLFEDKRFGWVFFFSQIDDLKQLARLDEFVRQELKIRELEHLENRVKKFLRTYHEIRYRIDKTNYIPNFDKYDLEKMVAEIASAEGKSEEEIRERYTAEQVERKFRLLINRHTRLLEQDLFEAFS